MSWVISFTYSEQAKYEAVGHDAPAAEGEESQVQTQCLDLATPEELAGCVRKEAAAQYKQQREDADLYAQQHMAAFAHGLLWFAGLSFLTGAGGLAALVWTFREQRKLTQNEAKAYVRVREVRTVKDDRHSGWLELVVQNDGKTPAQDVWLRFTTSLEVGKPGKEEMKLVKAGEWYPVDGMVVPANDEVIRLDIWSARRPIEIAFKQSRAEWIADLEKFGMPSVHISGEIAYDDVFGQSYASDFAFMSFDFDIKRDEWRQMWGEMKGLYRPVLIRPDAEARRKRKRKKSD